MDKLGMFVALIFMSIVGLACIKGGWANLGKDNGTAAFGMIFGSALLYGAYRAFESATRN